MKSIVIPFSLAGAKFNTVLSPGQLWDVPATKLWPADRFLITDVDVEPSVPFTCITVKDGNTRKGKEWHPGRSLAPIQPGDIRVDASNTHWVMLECIWNFNEWTWNIEALTPERRTNNFEKFILGHSNRINQPKATVTRKGNYKCACGSEALELFRTIECFNERCSHYVA